MTNTIGVMGASGSFSEWAGQTFLSKHQQQGNLVYLISAENVLAALAKGEVDYGVIGIANNRGGIVWESLYAIAKYGCEIIDRTALPIKQNLMTLPDIKLTDITEVHSHVQAISQCREFLFKNLWGVKLIEADDTAESARRLSQGQLPKTAAIIGRAECAVLYDLNLVAPDIHDLTANSTEFLWLQAKK